MREQLKKLNNLYSELSKAQKKLDSIKIWALWNRYVKPDSPAIFTFQQKVLNIQNEIDNTLIDAANEYGDDFMIERKKIIFSDVRAKDVAN